VSILAVAIMNIGVPMAAASEKAVMTCPTVATETPTDKATLSRMPPMTNCSVPTRKLMNVSK